METFSELTDTAQATPDPRTDHQAPPQLSKFTGCLRPTPVSLPTCFPKGTPCPSQQTRRRTYRRTDFALRTSIAGAASETLCSQERGRWMSEQVPGPRILAARGGRERWGRAQGSAQSRRPRAKADPHLPGLREGQALRVGQGHRWLPWGQPGHWALALQGLPVQEEADSQREAVGLRMQEGTPAPLPQLTLGPARPSCPGKPRLPGAP